MPNFDSQFQAGIDLAAELSKQLISLSTGILALSITFAKDIVGKIERRGVRLLGIAWIFYLLTIILALLHLSALTGALIPTQPEYSLKLANARVMATGQIIAFAIAMIFTFAFGLSILRSRSMAPAKEEPPVNPS